MTIDSTQALAHRILGAEPGLVLAHDAGGSIDGNFAPLLDKLAHAVVGRTIQAEAGHRVPTRR